LIDKSNQREQQARQALAANREDLARMALQEKENALTMINGYEQQLAQLRDQKEKLLTMQRNLTTRVEAFRTQKEMVKAQYSAAQAQVKINETLTGMSEEMSEVNMAMQRAQDKVLGMQARAEATEALIENDELQALPSPGNESTLDRELRKISAESTLDRELRKISAEQNIDAQLEALKQNMQLGGPNASPKQLEGPNS
jgi:phage shock protein A